MTTYAREKNTVKKWHIVSTLDARGWYTLLCGMHSGRSRWDHNDLDFRQDRPDGLCKSCSQLAARTHSEATVSITAYTVSRVPDNHPDHAHWTIRVEAVGHGKWAVRHAGSCLTKKGTWVYEPLPSSRTTAWLKRTRFDTSGEAIEAALAAEPKIKVNGYTPEDVLTLHTAREGR